MEWTDSALRDYLLGSASPETAERMEARVIEDGELFAALQSAEDDLFDACARGRLTAAERAQFLERYGPQPARLRFAHAWASRTPATSAPAFSRRPWIPMAAAAALILVAGALFTQLEAPSAIPVPQQSATAQPRLFAVTLALGSSRAA